MKKLKIALDWTANTNHSGFYVAKAKGFYTELGLAVDLITPDQDNYAVTPAKKVELGEADFALCPLESILSYNTKIQKFDAVALATIFKEDVSAIVSLAGSDIASPKDLDGKVYASYKARYEDKIVKQMVKNDGGEGDIKIAYPAKLGIWETLLTGKHDATWIFMNWEGVHAKAKGIPLRAFKMSDYGIPYGYSPVIMASRTQVEKNHECYAKFLKATKKGFLYAQKQPEYAVSCIAAHIALTDNDIDLLQSQKFSNQYYGTESNWGIMQMNEVQKFLDWLYEMELETNHLGYKDLLFDGLF